jgi:hypothetical protein
MARRIYFACALSAFSLFGVIIAAPMALHVSRSATLAVSPAAAWIVRLIVFPSILGTAILAVAMWYFWFGFDRSSWIKKTAWFLPLYLFLPIGPAFYYIFVYRRNESLLEGLSVPEKSGKLSGASLS